MYLAAHDPDLPPRVAAFAQGLQELGWTMGRNVRIDYRWGAGVADLYRRYGEDFWRAKNDENLGKAMTSASS